jgi:hypothetical protein
MPEAVLSRATAGVPLERLGAARLDRAGLTAFRLVFAGTALGAYALGPLPVQWLTQFFLLGVVGLLLLDRRLQPMPGIPLLLAFVGWAAVVTLARLLFFPYPLWMPPLASSPYPVYLTLRFMGLFTFGAAAWLVFWLLRAGYQQAVVRCVVWTGTVAALAAVYIYFAQLNGWWEPGRSRMGTGGGAQATEFAYMFHRAMGTFREPSHLAEWLVLPLFASFAWRGRGRNVHTGVMSVAMLLTGSLTGLAGMFAGLAGALVLANPFRPAAMKMTLRLGLALGLALVVFGTLAVGNRENAADLLAVVSDRIGPILEGGMGQSNRDYTFEYAASRPIPFVGEGLGNANIRFSNSINSDLIASLLSLYFNVLFSTGVIGLAMVLAMLALPVIRLARQRRYRTDPALVPLMAAYLGWLAMYTIHSEELTLVFGVLFGWMTWEAAGRPGVARETGSAAG